MRRSRRATGISVAILEKQVGELRRRLNTTGDIHRQLIRPRWANQLRLDLAGTPERNEANVITALSNDEAFAGALVFDEFRQEILVSASAALGPADRVLPRPWIDADDVRCAEWLQHREINVGPATVSRSVNAVARDMRVHPGARLPDRRLSGTASPGSSSWLITYLGPRTLRSIAPFGSRWMISAVARIMQPGAKVDHMLILEGPQGAKKSSALKMLAGAEWFTDELAEIGSKDAAQQMRGIWIIEIRRTRCDQPSGGVADQGVPEPNDGPLSAALRALRRRGATSVRVRRQRQSRHLFARRDRQSPLLAGSMRQDRSRCPSPRPRPVVGGGRRALSTRSIWWLDEPELIALAKAEQDQRYQADAWDARIDRWLVFERRRVNHGYGNYDDWRDEEVERAEPADRCFCRRSPRRCAWHRARALDERPIRCASAPISKNNGWERYQCRSGPFASGDIGECTRAENEH